MRRFLLLALALAACRTDQPPPQPEPVVQAIPVVAIPVASPTAPVNETQDTQRVAQVKDAIKSYTDAMNAWMENFRALGNDEAARKTYTETTPRPSPAEAVATLETMLAANASDEAAYQALVWLLRTQPKPIHVQRLVDNFAKDERIADQIGIITRADPSGAALAKVKAQATDRKVLGMIAWDEAERARRELDATPPTKTEAEVLALYQRIISEYADIPHRRRTLAQSAEGVVRELTVLAVGKVAPDIEGEDLAGVPFKLSDYRGKVVMLDFWGDW